MTDFNALLGNGSGIVFVFSDLQTSGELYTSAYRTELNDSADSPQAGRKEATAHSQGIYENSAAMRKQIERKIKDNVTKIGGVYNFCTNFYFNQTLSRGQALDYLTDDNLNGLLTHIDTEVFTNENGGDALIDALIGGTV